MSDMPAPTPTCTHTHTQYNGLLHLDNNDYTDGLGSDQRVRCDAY